MRSRAIGAALGGLRRPRARRARPPARAAAAVPDATRGFVKVQDGCDCHCAYCIIPTVRGGARSRPASAILREVAEQRVADGQPEMVMTGISVGDYRDPERGLELGELMVEVARRPGRRARAAVERRGDPRQDSLLRRSATSRRFVPHLHVPMQSGDDGVLRAMGRHYTVGRVPRAHRASARRGPGRQHHDRRDRRLPDRGRGARSSARWMRSTHAGITRVHVFPYSPRPGTVAAALGDRVAPAGQEAPLAGRCGRVRRSARGSTARRSSGALERC